MSMTTGWLRTFALLALALRPIASAAQPPPAAEFYDASCDHSGVTGIFREELAAISAKVFRSLPEGCSLWTSDLKEPVPGRIVLADRRRSGPVSQMPGLRIFNPTVALNPFFVLVEANGAGDRDVRPVGKLDGADAPSAWSQSSAQPTLFWVESKGVLTDATAAAFGRVMSTLYGVKFSLSKATRYGELSNVLNVNPAYRQNGFAIVMPVSHGESNTLSLARIGVTLGRLRVRRTTVPAVYPTGPEFDLALLRAESPERFDRTFMGQSGIGSHTARYPAVLISGNVPEDDLKIALARAYLKSAQGVARDWGYPTDHRSGEAQLSGAFLMEASALARDLAAVSPAWKQDGAPAAECAARAHLSLTRNESFQGCHANVPMGTGGCTPNNKTLARLFDEAVAAPSAASFARVLALCSRPMPGLSKGGLFDGVFEPYLPLAAWWARTIK